MKKIFVILASFCFVVACSHNPNKDRSSAGCAECSKTASSCPDCKDKKSAGCSDCK